MELEIRPDPSEAERAAIEAALEQELAEQAAAAGGREAEDQ